MHKLHKIRGKVSYTINLTIVDHTLGLIVVTPLFTLSGHLCIFLTLEVCWCSLPWLLSMASAHHIRRSPRVVNIPYIQNFPYLYESHYERNSLVIVNPLWVNKTMNWKLIYRRCSSYILTRVLDTCSSPSSAVYWSSAQSRPPLASGRLCGPELSLFAELSTIRIWLVK